MVQTRSLSTKEIWSLLIDAQTNPSLVSSSCMNEGELTPVLAGKKMQTISTIVQMAKLRNSTSEEFVNVTSRVIFKELMSLSIEDSAVAAKNLTLRGQVYYKLNEVASFLKLASPSVFEEVTGLNPQFQTEEVLLDFS